MSKLAGSGVDRNIQAESTKVRDASGIVGCRDAPRCILLIINVLRTIRVLGCTGVRPYTDEKQEKEAVQKIHFDTAPTTQETYRTHLSMSKHSINAAYDLLRHIPFKNSGRMSMLWFRARLWTWCCLGDGCRWLPGWGWLRECLVDCSMLPESQRHPRR